MTQEPQIEKITQYFTKVKDPRIDRTKRHKLMDILVIAILSIICGADSWTDIELFGQTKKEWLQTFLALPNGIPSHDTFGRVFAALDPEAFQASFQEWVQTIQDLAQGEVIALDGKQLRGSQDTSAGKQAIYLVSAWATQNQLVLSQRKVDEKSNEITAIPKLLKQLDLTGCIVTVDALNTQTKVAKIIKERGGGTFWRSRRTRGIYTRIWSIYLAMTAPTISGMPLSASQAGEQGSWALGNSSVLEHFGSRIPGPNSGLGTVGRDPNRGADCLRVPHWRPGGNPGALFPV